MSKKKAHTRRDKPQRLISKSRGRRKSLLVIALIFSLGLTGLVLAQWRTMRGSLSPITPTPQTTPSPQLSKEYIYAGGRLIATEEPVTTSLTLSAPTNFSAHANSITQINLSWASTGAQSYLIEWSTNYAGANNGFTTRTTVDCTAGCQNPVTYPDNVPASSTATTYLYRVRSVSGTQQSAPSTLDFVTTKSFDEVIHNQGPERTTIRAAHFLELRVAVNAVRAAAGMGPFAWSDPQGRAPVSGGPILRSHMQDLRNGLDQALSGLGLTPQPYSDHGLPEQPVKTTVRKAHIDEIRQRTKSVGQ